MEVKDILIYHSVTKGGDWDKIYNAISEKEDVTEEKMAKVVSKMTDNAITIMGDNYPDNLKHTHKPPFVLFYEGNINLLKSDKRKIAILGNRKNTDTTTAADIVRTNADCLFITGGTIGVQANACDEIMRLGLPMILILGHGLGDIYNGRSDIYEYAKTHGLILTEYPREIPPSPDYFPQRNRIIATLADSIVAVEVSKNSGTVMTIMFALQQGKDIYVVPQSYDSDLKNNELISEGAFVYVKGTKITEQVF